MNKDKKRILVVDDEETVTRMLKLNLEQTGEFEVATENSSLQVLHAVRTFHPDLILLDILMPEMTGDYVAQKLRDIAAFKDIPIIFLTAIGQKPPDPCPAERDPVIRKPVDTSQLIRMITERLALSRMLLDHPRRDESSIASAQPRV